VCSLLAKPSAREQVVLIEGRLSSHEGVVLFDPECGMTIQVRIPDRIGYKRQVKTLNRLLDEGTTVKETNAVHCAPCFRPKYEYIVVKLRGRLRFARDFNHDGKVDISEAYHPTLSVAEITVNDVIRATPGPLRPPLSKSPPSLGRAPPICVEVYAYTPQSKE
jgi:hypothetical protein